MNYAVKLLRKKLFSKKRDLLEVKLWRDQLYLNNSNVAPHDELIETLVKQIYHLEQAIEAVA